MMDKKDKNHSISGDAADKLLQQLFHLKSYEKPDAARLTKNKQNIMRQVREINSRKRRSLADLLAVNIPWFFAEPRYGIAALFIMFATLQFWGVSAQKQIHDKSDIYTRDDSIAVASPSSIAAAIPVNAVYTNHIYPELPENLNFVPEQQTDSGIKFVGRRIE